MVVNYSPFFLKFATVEQVFQPQYRSFVPMFLDLYAHTEQLLERAVHSELSSKRNGLVIQLIDNLFVG